MCVGVSEYCSNSLPSVLLCREGEAAGAVRVESYASTTAPQGAAAGPAVKPPE